METLRIIRDIDLGLETSEPTAWRERLAGRAVVFDANNQIALLHVTRRGYHKLPGGGVEEGEDIQTALQREALEEIGCSITDLKELGIIEEYRNDFSQHQTSHCFVARVAGEKGSPQFTQEEQEDGFEIVWLSLDKAIEQLETERTRVEAYEGKFMNARDLTFLLAAQQKL